MFYSNSQKYRPDLLYAVVVVYRVRVRVIRVVEDVVVAVVAHAVVLVSGARGRGAVAGAVQQRVVETDVVGGARDAFSEPVDFTCLPGGVEVRAGRHLHDALAPHTRCACACACGARARGAAGVTRARLDVLVAVAVEAGRALTAREVGRVGVVPGVALAVGGCGGQRRRLAVWATLCRCDATQAKGVCRTGLAWAAVRTKVAFDACAALKRVGVSARVRMGRAHCARVCAGVVCVGANGTWPACGRDGGV